MTVNVTEDTISEAAGPTPKFGFRRVLNETAALTFRAPLLVPAMVASFLMQVPAAAVGLWISYTPDIDPADGGGFQAIIAVVVIAAVIAFIAASALLSAFLVHRAARLADGEVPTIGKGVRVALRYSLPVFGGTLLVCVLMGLGFAALILPGVYLTGVFSVFLAVIVVEGRARGFIRRTMELTRGYRWTIAGLILLVYFVTGIVGAGLDSFGMAAGDGILATIFYLVVSGVGYGLFYAAICAAIVLIHRRLIEIKDGTQRPGLAKVFE